MNKKVVFALFVVLSLVVLASSIVVTAPATSPRQPKQKSNFQIEIEGVYQGSGLSVEGMGMEIEVIEYREGDDTSRIRKTNGLTDGGPIILRRVFDCNDELWMWFRMTEEYEAERKSMSIIFNDRGNSEGCRFNFFECWPSAYYIEPLEAQKSDVAVEVLVIEYEWMEWA